jgi:hypothetical protein
MNDYILIGRGEEMVRAPVAPFRRELLAVLETPSPRLAFLTAEHHRVRDAVVTGIPREGRPLTPALVAEGTGLSLARVAAILDELEARLFFLVRNADGDVSWAFPVTAEPTVHEIGLSTGESTYAA